MNLDEAARILREMYDSAPRGSKTLAVHQFGIDCGQEIKANGWSPSEIAHRAGLRVTWGPQINDGIKLASHIDLNDEKLARKQRESLYRVEYNYKSRKMEWDRLIRQIPSHKRDWAKWLDEKFSELPPETQNNLIVQVRQRIEED